MDVAECPDRPELEGKRAVVEPLVSCGACHACRMGRYNCCVDLKVMGVQTGGGLREMCSVEVRRLFPIPEGMPDETAVLAEPTSIAYRAVQRSGIEAGRVAVVFGAGTIGLLIAQILVNARGCRVLAVDLDPWRLEVAEKAGATPLPGGDAEGLVRAVSEATGEEMTDVVFEATGSPACTRMTTDLVAHAGRIVLIGWNPRPVEVDTITLMRKEADLLGSRNSTNGLPGGAAAAGGRGCGPASPHHPPLRARGGAAGARGARHRGRARAQDPPPRRSGRGMIFFDHKM